MSGSTLRINLPGKSSRHDLLIKRNEPYQHILESIYRDTDGKNLKTLLDEITANDRSVLCQRITVTTDGQREINITDFQYNIVKDQLIVTLQGIEVYEGIDCDYIKTSPTKITFNYDLKADYEVFILVAGTLSGESFGDDIYSSLSSFKQLVDVPHSFYGHGGKVVSVNQNENGLIFSKPVAANQLLKFEHTFDIGFNSFEEQWIPFINSGYIKGIRVTPTTGYNGLFKLSIWSNPLGDWVYYSGDIYTILWDIMTIPYIDESQQDCCYMRLENYGSPSTFKFQLYATL